MSKLFQVTDVQNKAKVSVVASQVVSVIDGGEGAATIITFVSGATLSVTETYRSVRGYVKKALDGGKKADVEEAE